MFKNFHRNCFFDFRVQASLKIENETMSTITRCLPSHKFQLRSLYSFGGQGWTTIPWKWRKFAISPNRKWRHQNKKKSISNFFLILSVFKISSKSTQPILKNPLHKTKIEIEKKKQYNNNKVFQWKRKTLIIIEKKKQ